MSLLMRYVYTLVFPDGLRQALETGPTDVQVGDLLSSEQLGITPEPTGKWQVTAIEVLPGPPPQHVEYHLRRF